MGFQGLTLVTIIDLEIDNNAESWSDCELVMWLHFKTTLAAIKHLFLFFALYQTFPWSSCRFFGYKAQEVDELDSVRRLVEVIKALETDPDPEVQRIVKPHECELKPPL